MDLVNHHTGVNSGNGVLVETTIDDSIRARTDSSKLINLSSELVVVKKTISTSAKDESYGR